MGLGLYPEIGLARAREKALQARALVEEGRDPLAERGRVPALTLKAAAEALTDSKRLGWRNAKHAAQWGLDLGHLRLSPPRGSRREGRGHGRGARRAAADLEAVRHDVRQGYVSVAAAAELMCGARSGDV